jgi:hypothetical protein
MKIEPTSIHRQITQAITALGKNNGSNSNEIEKLLAFNE